MAEEKSQEKKKPATSKKGGMPSKIGGYKPTQPIGHGSMGNIWLCHDPSMDRMVVVKQIQESLLGNEAMVSRFMQEASILAHLNHPNIVTPYALWKESDGKYSLSMEFIHGKSLREILDKCPTPPIWVVMIILYEMLSALGHAHREGVVHRDLKPANMMIDKDGRIRLLDFGVAHAETEDTALTMIGSVIGTAAYMSPEQTQGFEISPASDLFSIGIIASEMLIGQNLFRGESVAQTAKRIQKMAITSKAFPPEVPKKLRKFVLKLLEKKPKNRPISANDAADELSKMLQAYPRDLTPYLSSWVSSLFKEDEIFVDAPTYPNKAKKNLITGSILGALVASSIATLIHILF